MGAAITPEIYTASLAFTLQNWGSLLESFRFIRNLGNIRKLLEVYKECFTNAHRCLWVSGYYYTVTERFFTVFSNNIFSIKI